MTVRRRPVSGRLRVGLVLAMTAVSVDAASRQQMPTFRANVDLVRLDVLVVRNGRPVSGLTAADFEVRDNGVVQRIDNVSVSDVPVDVLLVLDTSKSVAGETLRHLRDAGHAFLEGLGTGDRAGLLTFNEAIRLGRDLTTDLGQVHAAVDRVQARGGTALRDAIHAAMLWPTRPESRPMVLVFSDGADTTSWLTPDAGMDVSRFADAVVYGVTMSGDRDDRFLERIAEATGGRLFNAASSRRLRSAFVEILTEMKARYVVSYYPQPTPVEGWHAVRVSVTRGRGETIARQGYYVLRAR